MKNLLLVVQLAVLAISRRRSPPLAALPAVLAISRKKSLPPVVLPVVLATSKILLSTSPRQNYAAGDNFKTIRLCRF